MARLDALTRPLQVVHADNHVLLVGKPASQPTVPDESGDESVLDRARAWVKATYGKPGEVFLAVVHRLDRPVSGLLLFGRTSKGASRLSEALREHRVEKRYRAVVLGGPRDEAGTVEHWLAKDHARNRVSVVRAHTEGARPARTEWRVLERAVDRTLIELVPVTGRPHQLRVALASLGCPIVGDLRYGARDPLGDRSIALHARRLAFPHPVGGARCVGTLEPPPTFPWPGRWTPSQVTFELAADEEGA